MTNARTPRFPRLAAALAVAACASPAWASAAPAADDEVARHYGFRPLEVRSFLRRAARCRC